MLWARMHVHGFFKNLEHQSLRCTVQAYCNYFKYSSERPQNLQRSSSSSTVAGRTSCFVKLILFIPVTQWLSTLGFRCFSAKIMFFPNSWQHACCPLRQVNKVCEACGCLCSFATISFLFAQYTVISGSYFSILTIITLPYCYNEMFKCPCARCWTLNSSQCGCVFVVNVPV